MKMIMKNILAEQILKNNTEGVITDDIDIVPCNTGVLIKFYDDNPYRVLETTKSGLIVGMQSTQKYRSNETGEMEENDEVVACAKVIAIGPKCQNVEVGEDVYAVKHIAIPVPVRKLGYYILSESNILCRIKKNDD
jgi:co-chaperonin GroES (HSP10)